MPRTLQIYAAVETVMGRSLAWRVGRWLYRGARRELLNDPRYNGEYALQYWITSEVGDGATYLDVGAHLGDWTASLEKVLEERTAAEYEIHVFEPAPEQFQFIQRRFDGRIAAGRVHVVASALAATESEVPFYLAGPGINSLMDLQDAAVSDRILVPATTIDNYAAAHGIKRIDLMKIDTEGNDFNVILGARSALQNGLVGVLQFEYNWCWIHFGHTMREVFAFAQDVGYHLGRLTANSIEIYDAWHPELDRFFEANFVMVHPRSVTRVPHAFMTFDGSNVACARSIAST